VLQIKTKGTIITVKGRNLVYGIPKTVEISSNEIAESLEETIKSIIIGIKKTIGKNNLRNCQQIY